MDYSFKVVECEDKMKNYFRDLTGRLIRDTLIVTLKNNGNKAWEKNKGCFKCMESKSNIFFETFQIPKDVAPNETKEFVLSFPRIEKNFNSGKMICTIQLVYNGTTYNDETFQFTKSFDITGNTVIRIRKEKEEEKRQEEYIKLLEEEKRLKEEEQLKNLDEMVQVEGGSDKLANIIKKFRTIFNMPEEEFDDNYIKRLIAKSDYDFNYAFNIHIDSYESESSESEEFVSSNLDDLKTKLRNSYLLPEAEFPDKVIEEALIDGRGNLKKSFARLMTFQE